MEGKHPLKSRPGRFLLLNGIAAGFILVMTLVLPFGTQQIPTREMKQAFGYMDSAIAMISDHCRQNRINLDPLTDPEATGLIGPELSDITTTAGDLAAKRTTLTDIKAQRKAEADAITKAEAEVKKAIAEQQQALNSVNAEIRTLVQQQQAASRASAANASTPRPTT